MVYYYRTFQKEDLDNWEKLAKSEFLPEDFCDKQYLLRGWDKTKGFILLDKEKWIGCCFLNFKPHNYNENGAHFLELIIFPEYRNKGYSKYLYKLLFDNSIGYQKSVCINPQNKASTAIALKYGFQELMSRKTWLVYLCPKDYYPQELQNCQLIEIR